MKKKKTFLLLLIIFSFIYVFAETPAQELNRKLTDQQWYIWYFKDILQSKNRDTIFVYDQSLKDKIRVWASEYDDWVYWYDYELWKTYVSLTKKNESVQLPLAHFYDIEDIKKNNSIFFVLVENRRLEQNKSFDADIGINWDLINTRTNFTFLFLFDGDYLDIFIDDFDTYFTTFCHFYGTAWEQLENLIYTNTCDLSRVTFPRRADKTHTVGATCIVAESLRLRKEENTSSTTLQIMQPGTRVQILQLGKKQTIDGITANWVQVEILNASLKEELSNSVSTSDQGADVRGATGWCFGGYIVEK